MMKIILLSLFVGSQSIRLVNEGPWAKKFAQQEKKEISEEDMMKKYHEDILALNDVVTTKNKQMAEFIKMKPNQQLKYLSTEPVQTFGGREGKPDTRPAVVCLGDSITEGNQQALSSGWLPAVSNRFKKLHFYNEGVSGDLLYNLMPRLPNATNLDKYRMDGSDKPLYAIIMIGTNHVIGSLNKEDERYSFLSTDCLDYMDKEYDQLEGKFGEMMRAQLKFAKKKWPENFQPKIKPEDQSDPRTVLSLANYEAQLTQTVQQVKNLGFKVAVMSQPPLGEDFTGILPPPSEYGPIEEAANSRTQKYVDMAKQIAESEGVDYLPVNEKLREILQAPDLAKAAFGEAPSQTATNLEKAWPGLRARFHLSAEHTKNKTMGASKEHPEFTTFESLTPPHLYLTHDYIHPNERGAAVIATMVDKWLRQVTQPKPKEATQ